MTTLRQKFIRELVLRGMSPKTQEAYVWQVYRLAKHYHRSPDQIGEEELKAFLFHLAKELRLSASTLNQAVSALRSFYRLVVHRSVDYLEEFVPQGAPRHSTPAGVRHGGTGTAVYGRLSEHQTPRLSDDGLWSGAAGERSLPLEAGRPPPLSHANPSRARQRTQGQIHASVSAVAGGVGNVLVELSSTRVAISQQH